MKKGTFFLLSAVASLVFLPLNVQAIDSSSSKEEDSSTEFVNQSEESLIEGSANSSEESVSSQEFIEESQTSTTEESSQALEQKSKSDKLSSLKAMDAALPIGNKPDKNGIYLLFPLVVGITSQPQEEQYILEGAAADLGIKTTSWLASLSRVSVKVRQWILQADGTWTDQGIIGTFTSSRSGVLGSSKQSIDISITGLKEGTYCFQLETKLNTLPIIGSLGAATYYSKMAKVQVKKEPVATKNMTITAPEVVFEHATYFAKAFTQPQDATSAIQWSSDLGEVSFSSDKGRNASFDVENQLSEINRRIDQPGLPFHLEAVAENDDGSTVAETKVVYLGGLAAKHVAQDSGFSWEVDSQGLADLNEAVESQNTWNYRWEYFDDKGTKQFTADDGVQHATGTLSNLTELNAENHLLTFYKDSKFMQLAAEATKNGKPFAVQVTFSTTVDTGKKGTETVKIGTNKAELLVSEPEGKLALKQVPNFNFGSIPACFLYEGSKENDLLANDFLDIEDTRYHSPGWQLSAQMSPFQSPNQRLEKKTKLRLTGDLWDVTVIDDDNEAAIMNAVQSEKFVVNAQLLLANNPNILLSENEKFSSTIIWTLTSAPIKANAAQ
jgi:hypothetical protein